MRQNETAGFFLNIFATAFALQYCLPVGYAFGADSGAGLSQNFAAAVVSVSTAAVVLAALFIFHRAIKRRIDAELRRRNESSSELYKGYLEMCSKMPGGRRAAASFRLDLAGDVCRDASCADVALFKGFCADTADGFFRFLLDRMEIGSGYGEAADKLSREGLLRLFSAGGRSVSLEHRFFEKENHPLWLRINILMLRGEAEGFPEALIFIQDIDAEKISNLLLEKTAMLEYEFMVVISCQEKTVNVIYSGTDSASLELGNNYESVITASAACFLAEEDRQDFVKSLDINNVLRELEQSDSFSYSCFFRPDIGSVRRKRWLFCYLDETRKSVIATRRDITEQFAADMDPLTGLYRREKFNAEARCLIDHNPDTRFAIMRFDLDRFKAYNDLFGEDAGDVLLADIAAILLKARKEIMPCVVGRIEADHFAVCLPAAKLRAAIKLRESVKLLEQQHPEFRFTMRAGVYPIDDPGINISIMSDRALMALRSIKGKDMQYVAFYNRSMRSRLIEEQSLVSELHEAFEKDQFIIYLQAQVNMTTGAIVGAEALARWNHPEKGIIPPGVFIPVLERRGHITQLDRIIWEKTCALLAKWKSEGRQMTPVSVNISRADAAHSNLCLMLRGLIQKYSLEPKDLRLEITESAYLDNPRQIITVVEKLRGAGFFVEMDDFGSGNSSLNTLKDVPTDLLKLDMKFLSPGGKGSRSGIILNSVISMAHWLKIPVIAEGVETVYQADYLRTIGCTMAQGFLYAKPVPPEEFELMMSSRKTEQMGSDAKFEAFFNNEEFWDPQAQATLIFNSFVGAAGIFEYSNGTAKPTRLNDRMFEILHVSRSDDDASLIFSQESVIEEDRAAYTAMIEKAGGEGCEVCGEIRVRIGAYRRTPQPLFIGVRMRCIAKRPGSCIIYVSMEDISARKNMEEQLRFSSEELKTALENMGRTLCYYDLEEKTLTLAPEYAKKHGAPLVLKNIPYSSTRVAEADRQVFVRFYEAALRGEPYGSAVVRIRNHDGTYAWESLNFTVIKNEDKKAARAIISIKDISEEMDREAVNQRNKLLVECTDSAIFDYDMMQDVLYYQTTIKGKGVISKTYHGYYDFIPESVLIDASSKESIRALIRRLAESPQQGSFEYIGDNWGLGMGWCRINYISIPDSMGRAYRVVGLIENIEDEKRCEELLHTLSSPHGNDTVSGGEAASNAAPEPLPLPAPALWHKKAETDVDIVKAAQETANVLDMAPSFAYIVDPETFDIVFCNERSKKLFNQDVRGQKCYSVFMQRDAQCADCRVFSSIQSGAPFSKEIHGPDGGCMIAHAAPIEWLGKRHMMVICTDITKLKNAEAALRSKTRDLNLIVRSVPGGIFKYSAEADEEFVYISRTMLDMLGYTRKEFVEKFQNRFSLMVYEKDRVRVLDEINAQIRVGDFDFCEYRIETKDGSLKWVHDVGHIVTEENGKKWFYVVIVDISQRVEAEEALRAQNEANAIVIAQSGKEVVRYNISAGTAVLSAKGAAALGLPTAMDNYPQSLIQSGIVDGDSLETIRNFYKDMKNGVKTGSIDVRMRLASGEKRWYHADYTLMETEGHSKGTAIISYYDNSETIEKERAYAQWQRDFQR